MDAKDGFHQVKLDEGSSYLTTFWTPFGRYRYLRMPFGISLALSQRSTRGGWMTLYRGFRGLKSLQMTYILVYGKGNTKEKYRIKITISH